MRSIYRLGSVSILAIAISLAQPAGVELSQEPLGNGMIEFTVKNVSPQPITAVFITATHINDLSPRYLARGYWWFDNAIHGDHFWAPLKYGESRSYQAAPHPREDRTEVAVRAVIFADGTTQGEPEWVELLLNWRRDAHRFLGMIREALQSAELSGASPETVLAELEQLQKKLRAETHYSSRPADLEKPESFVIDQAFGPVDVVRHRLKVGVEWEEALRDAIDSCRRLRRAIERARPFVIAQQR